MVSVESDVTYTRLDGVRLAPLPAATALRPKQGLIQDLRAFMDPSRLFPMGTRRDLRRRDLSLAPIRGAHPI